LLRSGSLQQVGDPDDTGCAEQAENSYHAYEIGGQRAVEELLPIRRAMDDACAVSERENDNGERHRGDCRQARGLSE
jgi:hypothetical protein